MPVSTQIFRPNQKFFFQEFLSTYCDSPTIIMKVIVLDLWRQSLLVKVRVDFLWIVLCSCGLGLSQIVVAIYNSSLQLHLLVAILLFLEWWRSGFKITKITIETMSVSYQDSGSGVGSQYRIPDELQEILLDFTVNYLIEQPSDIARLVYSKIINI